MTVRSSRTVASAMPTRSSGFGLGGNAWYTNAGLLVLGGLLFQLTRMLIVEYDHYVIGFSGVAYGSLIVYLAAAFLATTQPTNRWTLPIILTIAVLCRLVALYPDPFQSTDIFRYVWDGVVQHAGINPYRYVPGDKALEFLRDDNADVFASINRRDYAHTIYPPVAQIFFWFVTFISPTVTFMKTAMVAFECVTVLGLLALLRRLKVRAEQVILYAWMPLVLWEFSASGHLDAVAIALIVLALLFRASDKPLLTGLFLGLAIATKLYPIVLLPALFRRREADGRAGWRMPAIAFAVVAIGYLLYSSVGLMVFGFLGGYVQEEGIETGGRYFLLELTKSLPDLAHLPTSAFFALSAIVFGTIVVWCWRTCCSITGATSASGFLPQAFALAFALMMLFSPHYPWYVAWLVPFLILVPSSYLLTYLCAFFYLFTTSLALPGPKLFLLNKYMYGAVFAAVLLHLALRRWPAFASYFRRRPDLHLGEETL